jgi:hypothetical protein
MKIAWPVILKVILFLGSVLFISASEASAQFQTMTPIFDGSKYHLNLLYCHGYETGPVKKENFDVPWLSYVDKNVVKKFKFRKFAYIEESWKSRDLDVKIERWYFDNPEDPVLWAESGIETDGWPTIWSKKADVGDKTWWLHQFDMFFIKRNVLVRVFVNPMGLDENTKNHTRKIARAVARKF